MVTLITGGHSLSGCATSDASRCPHGRFSTSCSRVTPVGETVELEGHGGVGARAARLRPGKKQPAPPVLQARDMWPVNYLYEKLTPASLTCLCGGYRLAILRTAAALRGAGHSSICFYLAYKDRPGRGKLEIS